MIRGPQLFPPPPHCGEGTLIGRYSCTVLTLVSMMAKGSIVTWVLPLRCFLFCPTGVKAYWPIYIIGTLIKIRLYSITSLSSL